jgi:hypothetical protein
MPERHPLDDSTTAQEYWEQQEQQRKAQDEADELIKRCTDATNVTINLQDALQLMRMRVQEHLSISCFCFFGGPNSNAARILLRFVKDLEEQGSLDNVRQMFHTLTPIERGHIRSSHLDIRNAFKYLLGNKEETLTQLLNVDTSEQARLLRS